MNLILGESLLAIKLNLIMSVLTIPTSFSKVNKKKAIEKIAKSGAIPASAWASYSNNIVTGYIARVPTISIYKENREVVSHQFRKSVTKPPHSSYLLCSPVTFCNIRR